MRLALAQIDTVVGDLDGNRDRILAKLEETREAEADLVLFPELAVTGYPPEDLLLRPSFLKAAAQSLDTIAAETRGVAALVGTPHLDRDLFNACAVCAAGEVKAVYKKRFLPNYGVFDEDRYFQAGRELLLLRLGETLVGVTICEDIWQPGPPATDLALAGAHVVANVSASPFHLGKGLEREEMLATRARDNVCWVALVNAVGGQDELVFDGQSLVIDQDGRTATRGPAFEEALLVADIEPATAIGRRLRDARRRALARERPAVDPPLVDLGDTHDLSTPMQPLVAPRLDRLEEMRLALELGLRDYVEKNGFREVVLGLSGGIDSALTAALAVEALGPDRVVCVSMPSRYSSADTRADACRTAEVLGTRFLEIPIDGIVEAFRAALAHAFEGTEEDVTEENIQARVRGTLLMALSNKFGWLLTATGNKSELSVGYATLYGDMAGGFAPLKDVFKTDVFALARHLNERAGRELIPTSTIERAPSAELREGQRDEDSLPPYAKLDRVLEAYIELDQSREELSLNDYDPEVVERALALVDRAEYKRRQAPPGVKLRPKAFGRDRRVPITNRWVG
ncbi:MAG TPA: NAD+ synthase [Gaiellaceae bacterium]|jgi:NAD+ synthase (glutamine-hydrolysing)|nr:NAD+ synthase [Gaiellaceae bacterium]